MAMIFMGGSRDIFELPPPAIERIGAISFTGGSELVMQTVQSGRIAELVLTGATPFVKISGVSLESVTTKHFGYARSFWADLQAFGLVGGRVFGA